MLNVIKLLCIFMSVYGGLVFYEFCFCGSKNKFCEPKGVIKSGNIEIKKGELSMEEIEEVVQKVIELIQDRKINDLKKYLETVNSADFPTIFEELDDEKIKLVYRILPKDKAAEVFVELDHDDQERLITYLTDREIKNVMDELYMDDAVDLVEEMPSDIVERILKNTRPSDRKVINELLKYPDDTAGSLMTTEFVSLYEGMTVKDAFVHIKNKGLRTETVYNCYVLDDKNKLVGIVDIKDLLLADTDTLVKDIMDTNVISVSTLEDQEKVSKMFDKYDLITVPVVDKEGAMVGVITIDDAFDVMQEEVLEDFEKMAAINSSSNDSYLKTPVFVHAKNRILWLLFLMLSATITGAITNSFEATISSIPLLVAFMPMLMDTGGNCGSQSSTLIIRGLATDEISTKDYLRAMWKELRVATCVGLILAVLNGIRIAVQYSSLEYGTTMALVVSLSIFFVVIFANFLGCTLPIFAKKLKLDPAIMAAPLISTIVDSCSVLLFFTLASMFIHV